MLDLMPYKILENIAHADFAVEVTAGSLSELFHEAAVAIQSLQFDLSRIEPKTEREIKLEGYTGPKELLYDFLTEVIFYKDSEALALGQFEVDLQEQDSKFSLKVKLRGERIDPRKHGLESDVKAITRHRFELKKEKGEWKAVIVVDV